MPVPSMPGTGMTTWVSHRHCLSPTEMAQPLLRVESLAAIMIPGAAKLNHTCANNARKPMFEASVPKYKIGCLQPGAVIDNAPFEFYRLAPPGVMLVMVGVGLKEFSSQDVERVFEPLDR